MPCRMHHWLSPFCFFFLSMTLGCGQSGNESSQNRTRSSSSTGKPAALAQAPIPEPTPPPPPAVLAQSNTGTAIPASRLEQPFDAAVAPLTPLASLPPTRLVTGKSVGKIYDDVKKNWANIRLTTPQGNPIHYRVTLQTSQGEIVMEMMPEVAPNHVRNFIALAQAGYYDGLRFETRIGEKSTTSAKAIAGGSPLGDGDDIVNVGYWLQHEILNEESARQRGIKHVAGTVGAVHVDSQPNTSSCRFYICLSEAKELDGEFTIFAKVVSGLDVAEKIFQCPVDESVVGPKPFTQPIEIKKAVVSKKSGE
jgi:cyclophilin family peptidyl-prolyl cis-trans isomerase